MENGSQAGVTVNRISWSVIHPMRESRVGKTSLARVPGAEGTFGAARFFVILKFRFHSVAIWPLVSLLRM